MVEQSEKLDVPEQKPLNFVDLLIDPTLQENQQQMSETIKNLDFGDLCLEEDLGNSEEEEDRSEELKTEQHRADIVKKSNENMSKGEMMQIIESQRREIKYLSEKLKRTDEEKCTIIENFKLSTSVLIERIKDLEAS